MSIINQKLNRSGAFFPKRHHVFPKLPWLTPKVRINRFQPSKSVDLNCGFHKSPIERESIVKTGGFMLLEALIKVVVFSDVVS
jgi:hypothetical protein